ncbi:hypothetical protein Sjap_017886 [Stephania japonica]|uniref:Uncharacterized protein n=1 Tax=Stephania japonica TaxID=461633 RepID=A0AAP0NMI9_9MAGN
MADDDWWRRYVRRCGANQMTTRGDADGDAAGRIRTRHVALLCALDHLEFDAWYCKTPISELSCILRNKPSDVRFLQVYTQS